MAYVFVPYISQWSASANAFRADCGVACVAMLLALYNKLGRLTVDRLAQETALAGGNVGLMPAQLVGLAARHGLKASVRHQVSVDDLRAQVSHKRPVIVLIAYRFLTGRLDQNDDKPGSDGHFVVVNGFDDDRWVCSDPDYWAPYVNRGQDVFVPLGELEQAMAEYDSQAMVLEEDMGKGAQIINLCQQIEALAAGIIEEPKPPVIVLIQVTITSANGANVRSSPIADVISNKVGGLKFGTKLFVEESPVHGLSQDWWKIGSGQFAGNYVAVSVAAPVPNP